MGLKPYVAFTPDIYQLKRTEDDLFLVLASDGLWEDLEASDCMNIMKKELKEGNTLEACATAMVDLALQKGSDDNICVVIVDLRDAAAKASNVLQLNTRKRKVEDSPPDEPKLQRSQSTAGRVAIAAKVQEH